MTEPSDKFKFGDVAICGKCPVREYCPITQKVDDNHLCDYEMDFFRKIMSDIQKDYNLSETSKLLLESLIANEIIAWRVRRDIKFTGLKENTEMVTKEGQVINITRENILKSGLHLDYSRIIRLLKEMKLTPREQEPKRTENNINVILKQVVEGIKDHKFEIVPAQVRKKKKREEDYEVSEMQPVPVGDGSENTDE